MQHLWQLHCEWDDEISQQYFDSWYDYHHQFPSLNALRIPRWITFGSHIIHSALHGFSDASTAAFAAVYLRTLNNDNSVNISFLTAKSKVAPLKTLSVIKCRLELSAALLLTCLIHFVQCSQFRISSVIARPIPPLHLSG